MRKTTIIVSILLAIFMVSCKKKNPLPENINLRQEMRDFVIEISDYAKNVNENFIVIPQNGQALITNNGKISGIVNADYVKAIDATGREDLFYGYSKDDKETPAEDKQQMLDLCALFEQNNVEVLITDYCSTRSNVDNSYQQNHSNGFISFAADERNLNNIPLYPASPFNENADDITKASDAKNFLYLINPEEYSTKSEMLTAIAATNFDLVIIDAFFNDEILTANDLSLIKHKNNGSKRIIVAYVSIGEAEDYRYYWNSDWKKNKPSWLDEENLSWKGNYKVRYWEQDWKNIIYGSNNAYLDKVLNSNFDGIYLDIIDAFEYFEDEYDLSVE